MGGAENRRGLMRTRRVPGRIPPRKRPERMTLIPDSRRGRPRLGTSAGAHGETRLGDLDARATGAMEPLEP